MASLLDLCAAMRAAAVTSVFLSSATSITSRTTWYQLTSDFPAVWRVDDAIFDRITGYDHIDGLTFYRVDITRAATLPYRADAGRGQWSIGTLGSNIVTTTSSSQIRYLSFRSMLSPRPLDIQTFTVPSVGYTGSTYWSNDQYQNAISSLNSRLVNCQMRLQDRLSFISGIASKISAGVDDKSISDRLDVLVARAARSGIRVVFSRRWRPIRFGGY